MSTDYKDTILWVNTLKHFKNIIRGDMMHITGLNKTDRILYHKLLVQSNRDRFTDAWVNAKVDAEMQASARHRIEGEAIKELEVYYQEIYNNKYPQKTFAVTRMDRSIANNEVDSHSMHFQPYGFQPYGYQPQSRSNYTPSSDPINTNDWISQSSYAIDSTCSSDSGSSSSSCE